VAGVCGGLAEYFDIDVTVIRLVWILSFFLSLGAGLLLYIAAAIIIPKGENTGGTVVLDENGNETFVPDEGNAGTKNNSLLFIGVIMIVLGGFALMNKFLPFRFLWNQVKEFSWPLLLVLAGVLILVASFRKRV
jgi:phage shock protein PspC (stress-responsive transcriptional regulator)